ncbi:hypothetical protein OIE68_46070 [Nocardia vinacea]|nr:hypothetical protein OIE68_46070 [Nocardia vinacea]
MSGNKFRDVARAQVGGVDDVGFLAVPGAGGGVVVEMLEAPC